MVVHAAKLYLWSVFQHDGPDHLGLWQVELRNGDGAAQSAGASGRTAAILMDDPYCSFFKLDTCPVRPCSSRL